MIRTWCTLLPFLVAAPAFAQNSVADTPYFPAAEGATWTYRLPDRKVTVKVTKHEKQDGALAARFETLDKTDILAVQHVTVTDKAVARTSHNGEKVTPPLTLLLIPPAKGQSWPVASKAGAEEIKGQFTNDVEDVKVPAGEYKKALRGVADLTINGQKVMITSWYAEKVGLVKQRISAGGNEYEMVLEKFEMEKKDN